MDNVVRRCGRSSIPVLGDSLLALLPLIVRISACHGEESFESVFVEVPIWLVRRMVAIEDHTLVVVLLQACLNVPHHVDHKIVCCWRYESSREECVEIHGIRSN